MINILLGIYFYLNAGENYYTRITYMEQNKDPTDCFI